MENTPPQNLITFLEHKGLTQKDVAKILCVSEQTVNALVKGRRNFGRKSADDWQRHFGLSSTWLRTGTGPMLIDGTDVPQQNNGDSEQLTKDINLAPNVYEGEYFSCGFPGGESGAITRHNMEKTLIIPGAPKDVIYVRAHGDSMVSDSPHQSIPDGAYVAIRKINDREVIRWGEVYALATADGLLIKKLMPGDDRDCVRCVSHNSDEYPEFEMRKSDIKDIAIVVGVFTMAWMA